MLIQLTGCELTQYQDYVYIIYSSVYNSCDGQTVDICKQSI